MFLQPTVTALAALGDSAANPATSQTQLVAAISAASSGGTVYISRRLVIQDALGLFKTQGREKDFTKDKVHVGVEPGGLPYGRGRKAAEGIKVFREAPGRKGRACRMGSSKSVAAAAAAELDEGLSFNKDTGLLQCPAGELAIRVGKKAAENGNTYLSYFFSKVKCRKCLLYGQCRIGKSKTKCYNITQASEKNRVRLEYCV